MEEQAICNFCGNAYSNSDLILFDGSLFCEECFRRLTVRCDECGRRIRRSDDHIPESIILCSNCRDTLYYTCPECGELLRNSNEEHVCFQEEHESLAIEDYYYKPTPIFYGEGTRYFGVELELDGGGEESEKADTLKALANRRDNHIYIKHDGSLNDGFEIVTHPMTLDYHKEQMPWSGLTEEALELGYLSHQAHTCGLHIHVNRNCFGKTQQEQEDCISRVLFFVEKHWEELLKFSRRTQYQLDRWAARYGYKSSAKELLCEAKKCGNGRYSCINLGNTNTIEFRIFRGSLRHNTIIATLQMVDQICDLAFSMSDEEMQELSWTSFVEGIDADKMPELVQYLKERRIYINDEVETEEER